ncbi:hypothetical protein FGRMN_10673 [Fusarium graminum]|nr:hypothetical protein FGRMN_10673 [Fusarium graminum]
MTDSSRPSKGRGKDAHDDLAKNSECLSIRVEADGRKQLQCVYLWNSDEKDNTGTGSMKGSRASYMPSEYRPSVVPYPRIPSGYELVHDPETTTAYLEVGLVVGDNPGKYRKESASIGGTSTTKGESIILSRDENALRVFIPLSETAHCRATFFVGYSYSRGRLFPAMVSSEHVFFYPEF